MVSQTVTLQGHIIDSLILAKVLDAIVMLGGTFTLTEIQWEPNAKTLLMPRF